MSDDSLVLRGEFDGASLNQGLKDTAAIADTIREATDRASAGIKGQTDAVQKSREATTPWARELEKATEALQDNVFRLQAQKELLADPVQAATMRRTADLRKEIEGMTRAILDQEKAEATLLPDVRAVTDAMGQQTAAMRAQLDAMKSAEGQGYLKTQQALKVEMSELTKVTNKHDDAEKGVFSNMRTRREAMVMAHEAMMGQTKNLMGSAMVFAEYADLNIMHAATAMINPYTIAAAAVAGLGIALVELNYKAAEHLHTMTLMGMEVGATGEQMIAFEHASIGTGVSARELGTSLSHFTLNLSRHSEELKRAGITAKDPIEAFEQLMDVARKIQDPIQRDQLLNEALGESYRKMVPLIMQGGDALRDAIKEMKIPEGVLEDYEKLNALEVENAKAWDTIKHNSQGALSGISLGLREIKAGFLDQVKSDGWLKTLGSAIIEPPWLKAGMWGAKGEEIARAAMEGAKKGAGGASAILPKEVQDILDKAKGAASKTSRERELADERVTFQEELSQLVRHHAKTEDLIEAHKAKVAAIEAKWKKKGVTGKKAGTQRSSQEYEDFFDHEASKTRVMALGMENETMSKMEKQYLSDLDKVEKKQAEIDKAERKLAVDRAKVRQSEAKLVRLAADEEARSLKKRMAEWDKYSNSVKSHIDSNLSYAITSDDSWKAKKQKIYEDVTHSMINSGIEWVTSSIAQMAKEEAFRTATRSADASESAALMAESTALAQLNAATLATAYGPAAAAASLASYGANSIPAQAGMTSTYGLAEALSSVPARASGGSAFGSTMAGEYGPERITPYVPSRVTTHSQTNHYGGHTIIINGAQDPRAVADEVARVSNRSSRSATANRRQTSF